MFFVTKLYFTFLEKFLAIQSSDPFPPVQYFFYGTVHGFFLGRVIYFGVFFHPTKNPFPALFFFPALSIGQEILQRIYPYKFTKKFTEDFPL